MLGLPIPFPRRLSFIPPRLDPEQSEWERAEDPEERELQMIDLGLHSGLVDVHVRPMVWTTSPPSAPGWWWCRFKGAMDVIEIKAGEEFRSDPRISWSSCPVPTPGPVERRR